MADVWGGVAMPSLVIAGELLAATDDLMVEDQGIRQPRTVSPRPAYALFHAEHSAALRQ